MDDGTHRAVNGVSLAVSENEIFGIVGESGSGKSVTCLALAGLLPEKAMLSGRITLGGKSYPASALRKVNRHALPPIGIVFQEPTACLNPVRTIGSQLIETAIAGGMTRQQAAAESVRLLERVGIANARERMNAYSSEFSGGMCQRVMIAMALAMQPRLIIADEPTTALDVTVQAQVVALLSEVVRERGIPMIFISHDLDLIAETCDRVAVMYSGAVVEVGDTGVLYNSPSHPYTKLLIDAMPGRTESRQRLADIPGEIQPMSRPPTSCSFAMRCPRVLPGCRSMLPQMEQFHGRSIACMNPWRADVVQ